MVATPYTHLLKITRVQSSGSTSKTPESSTFCSVTHSYGVATISRLLQIIGLFCKRAPQKRLYSTKETYDFKEPTNRSHPILAHPNTLSHIFGRDGKCAIYQHKKLNISNPTSQTHQKHPKIIEFLLYNTIHALSLTCTYALSFTHT